jgi:hypothetical protein
LVKFGLEDLCKCRTRSRQMLVPCVKAAVVVLQETGIWAGLHDAKRHAAKFYLGKLTAT